MTALYVHDFGDNIQNCINAVAADGGGYALLDDKVYDLGSSVTTVQGAIGQIHAPSILYSTTKGLSVILKGPSIPAQGYADISTDFPVPTCGAILLTSAASGAVITGAQVIPNASDNFTGVTFGVEALTIRSYQNPQVTGIDFELIGCCKIIDVAVDTNCYQGDLITQPTHSNAYGVKLPKINNGARTFVRGLLISGYYTLLKLGEHANIDDLELACGWIEMEVPDNIQGILINRVLTMHCPYGIVCTASGTYNGIPSNPSLQIVQRNIEYLTAANKASAPSWQVRIADVYDPNNRLIGAETYVTTEANVGPGNQFIRNGGANFLCSKLGSGQPQTQGKGGGGVFNAPNGTSLSALTPPWTIYNGSWSTQDGSAVQATRGGVYYATAVEAGKSDVTINCDLTVPSTLYYCVYLVGRTQGAGNTLIFALEKDGTNPYMLIAYLLNGNGYRVAQMFVPNLIGTIPVTVTLAGITATMKLASGETISGTISQFASNTKFGLGCFQDVSYAPGSWSNFVVA